MKSLNRGAALSGLVTAIGACVIALASDFHLWYDGPGKAAIGAGIGIGLMWWRSRQLAKSFADMGDTKNVDRD